MKDVTRIIHAAVDARAPRTVNPPVERGSTVLMPDAASLYASWKDTTVYGLQGLTVQRTLAQAVAELEHAERACLTPSGLSAMAVAIMAVTRAGDEILITDAVYGPTRKFCDDIMGRYGVTARYYDPAASTAEVLAMVGASTRLLVLETPGSLTFEMPDLPALIAGAKARGVLTVVDNSWAGGVLFKPLDHGADLSMQALTKYAGGHSDVLIGSIATRDPALGAAVQAVYDDMGWFVAADEAYLALRGMRTMHLRLAHQHAAGLAVARWLAGRPEVARVLHPALEDFPGHPVWKRDFTGANGLFGVVMKGGSIKAAEAFLDRLELFGLGFSWGGFESLAVHCDPQLKVRANPPRLEGPLMRFHVGLEDVGDLIADLEEGLKAYASA